LEGDEGGALVGQEIQVWLPEAASDRSIDEVGQALHRQEDN